MAAPSVAHRKAGVFVAIAGPSGAGKDSLLAGAATIFANDPRIVFARRVITRPADATEPYEPSSMEAFRQRVEDSSFLLWWEANGYCYGLPIALGEAIDAGCLMIANVSREVLPQIRARFAHVHVVHVTASAETLEARLMQRGRETPEQCRQRLTRALEKDAAVVADLRLATDGSLQDGVDQLIAALQSLLEQQAHHV
ncbi:MAG: phosphonate metabolism protein/1,5-bisphosphokinase (PRPP-forming) PhnN [Bosea sp. (in: a-proteobacteria)]